MAKPPDWEKRARDALALTVKHHNHVQRLKWALRFYADERRYHGPNQRTRWYKDDPYPSGEGGYFLDVTRDAGDIARKVLQEVSDE